MKGFRPGSALWMAVMGGGGLVSKISSWQNTATRIHCAGVASALFPASPPNAYGPDLTIISNDVTKRIVQNGYIRQAVVRTPSTSQAGNIKIKVFRPNGSDYDFVGESELIALPAGAATHTLNLASPIPCQPGDTLGIWMQTGSGTQVKIGSILFEGGIRYVSGDITSSNAFASTLTSGICLEGLTNPPYFAFSGDSIAEGGNTANTWKSLYNAGPTGTITSEPAYQMRSLIGNGSTLQYQNHAKNGWKIADVLSTGMPGAILTQSKVIWLHVGTNDIAASVSWNDFLASLDSVKALLQPGQIFLVDEVLPRTQFSDALAAVSRTYNANLAAWCMANSATLILCHDEMAKIRASTGALDDFGADYGYTDGIHLSQSGVNKLAEIVRRYLT
jgi:lysophospholipase L1-like esterase